MPKLLGLYALTTASGVGRALENPGKSLASSLSDLADYTWRGVCWRN
jgi:hypothetical protein